MNYWLFKSEPEVYSIDDLKRDKKTLWEGVRNYQARNFLRDTCKPNDLVLFYHSNAEPPGLAGIAKIQRVQVPDPSQFDKKSEYYDPKSKKEAPTWICVEVAFERKFKELVSLETLRKTPTLQKLLVLQRGQRLSIQPVTSEDFSEILKIAK